MKPIGALVAIALALVVGGARADGPGAKCRVDKIKATGLYDLCRSRAEARAARIGTAPTFARCNEKLGELWSRIEAAAAGACPTTGELGTIENQVGADVRDVVQILTPPAPSCGTYPGCGGDCEPGLVCGLVAPPAGCGCIAPQSAPCTATGGGPADFPLCDGGCPDGQVCAGVSGDVGTTTIGCGCIPAGSTPCVNGFDPSCGGACPAGTTCGAGVAFPCECH